MQKAMLAGLCAAVLGGCETTGWYAENDLAVSALPDGGFEVMARTSSGAADFWCAAGDYALRALGAKSTQRIYVVKAQSRSPETGRRVVQFSLSPPDSGPIKTSLLLSVDRVGENLSVSFSRNYCLDRKFIDV